MDFDDFSTDIASETFDMDLDDIQIGPSTLDDSNEEAAELFGY